VDLSSNSFLSFNVGGVVVDHVLITLLRILLIHRNILLKNCSGESLSGRISCDSV